LKVTPAHDPDDWQIGQRHGLEVINVMAPDGSISDKYGWEDANEPEAQSLLDMDRFEARERKICSKTFGNMFTKSGTVIAAMCLSSLICPTSGISP